MKWLFMLCVFIVGVFVGIWMDLSARNAGGQDYVYQVQTYQMANLEVQGGDRLWLEPPPGGDSAGLLMHFLGGLQLSPCVGGVDVNPCVIKTGLTPGAGYLFTCNSPQGYSCTDPGVQQSGSGPFNGEVSYGRAVKTDFGHLFGLKKPVTRPAASGTTGARPAAGAAIRAYVGCSANNVTTLQDPNGNDLTTISASTGTSVFWISPVAFSLDLSSAPGLCSNTNPNGGGPQPAQCTIALSPQTVHYKVQSQTTPACGVLAANLVITK